MKKRFEPRDCQNECSRLAMAHYREGNFAFVAAMSVGSGKTLLGAWIASQMVEQGMVRRVILICPNESVKNGWVKDFATFGLAVRPMDGNNNLELAIPRDEHGYASTYASVASFSKGHRSRAAEVPTLVVCDELHHLGDARRDDGEATRWAQGCIEAFMGAAKHVLVLTGTPGRGDNRRLPFVEYDLDASSDNSTKVWMPRIAPPSGYCYSYGQAVADKVVRRTEFRFVNAEGQVTVRSLEDGEQIVQGGTSMRDDKCMLRNALERRVLNTAARVTDGDDGIAAHHILERGIAELNHIRAHQRDAAGLVVCSRVGQAEHYAKLLRTMGQRAVVVYRADDIDADDVIARFRQSDDDWIVAVNMVSEGVNIPRLRVCCFLSVVEAELTLMQIVGRIVRINWQSPTTPNGEVPPPLTNNPTPRLAVFVCLDKKELHDFAAAMEKEVNAAIRERDNKGGGEGGGKIEYEETVVGVETFETGGIVGQTRFGEDVVNFFDRLRALRPDTHANVEDAAVLFQMAQERVQAEPREPVTLSVIEQKEMLTEKINSLAKAVGMRRVSTSGGESVSTLIRNVHAEGNRTAGIKTQPEATVDQLRRKLEWLERIREMAA